MLNGHNLESIQGKHLGEAAELVTEQIKYVIDRSNEIQEFHEPLDPVKAATLQEFLREVCRIKDNVKYFLTASGLRLAGVEQGIKIKLSEAGLNK